MSEIPKAKVNNRNDAPRQSGMEREHELWVTDVLNFLNNRNIPVYAEEPNKRVMNIPERLIILDRKINQISHNLRCKEERVRMLDKENAELRKQLCKADEVIGAIFLLLNEGIVSLTEKRPDLFDEKED